MWEWRNQTLETQSVFLNRGWFYVVYEKLFPRFGCIVFLNNAYTLNEVENGEEGASVEEYKGKMEMQWDRFTVSFT